MTARHPAGNPRRVSPSTAHSAPWWRHPAWIVAAAALLLYLPVLGYGFVRDDHELVEDNPFLRRAGYLGRLLGSDYWASSGGESGLWRPLVLLSYWLDGRLGGWQAAWFHGVNALLHAIAAGLVVLLAAQVVARATSPRGAAIDRGGPAADSGGSWIPALLAGLWFAAMPLHVESVAWISGRTDVMCALAFTVALWADRRARASGAAWPGALAVVAFAAALLAKEAALPLVLAFVVAERIERPDGRLRWTWLLPYAAVAAAYVVAHFGVARGQGVPSWIAVETLQRRHWTGWTMLAEDVAFFWPGFPHAAERLLALPSSPFAPQVIAGAAFTLAAFAVAGVLAWRRAPAAMPLAVFLLPLTPTIALAVARGYVAHAERLVYTSSVGAAWLLAMGLTRADRSTTWRLPARAAAALLVVASAWVTWRVLPDWRDDASMYAAMVRAQPEHVEGRIGLASTMVERGRIAEAHAQLDAAERLESRHPALHVTRALAALRSEDWPAVLAAAQRARAADPARTDAALLEAQALVRLHRLDEADRALADLLARNPGLPQAEALLGELRLAQGRAAEAAELLRRAAGWTPGDAAVWMALGRAELESGQPGQAQAAFRRTVALAPGAYSAWLQLALVSHQIGDHSTRDAALERALRLPGAADGRADSLKRRFAR